MKKLEKIESLAKQIEAAKASRAAYDALISALEAEKTLLEEEFRTEEEKEIVKAEVETVSKEEVKAEVETISEEETAEEICENSLTDEQIAQAEEIFNDEDYILSEEFEAELEEALADMPADIDDLPDFSEESLEGNKSEKIAEHQKKPLRLKSSIPEEIAKRFAEKRKRAQQRSANLRYISRRSHYGNRGIRT